MSSSPAPTKPFYRRRSAWVAMLLGAVMIGSGIMYWKWHQPSAESQASAAAASAPAATPSTAPVAAAPATTPAPQVEAPKTDPTVYFAFDDASLSSETKAALELWVARLDADKSLRLELEGHCDERGSDDYNQALGERRADAAKDFLVERGVDEGRISTISYGRSRPAALGHDESAWAKNRRVELRAQTALSQR